MTSELTWCLVVLTVGICPFFGTDGSTFESLPSDCAYNGDIVKEGNTYKIAECEECVCMDGAMYCCPLYFLEKCNTTYKPCQHLPQTGDCVFREKIYTNESQFETENCFNCYCKDGRVGCSGYGILISSIDDEMCKIVQVDKCNQKAVLKSNETELCPWEYFSITMP